MSPTQEAGDVLPSKDISCVAGFLHIIGNIHSFFIRSIDSTDV